MSDDPRVGTVADVRPILDVIKDVRAALVRELPGDAMVMGCWTTINECARIIDEADAFLEGKELGASDSLNWAIFKAHGENHAAHRLVRRLADALGVPNEYSKMK